MAAIGSVFKRCGCTEVVDGKRRQLGKNCPKLRRADGTWNPRHGTWTYTTSVRGVGGKRRQIMRGGYATQGEAQRELDALRDKARRGIVVADRLTVGEYLDEWLASKSDIRPGTRRAYEAHIRRYLRPHLGHIRLEDLRVAHVADALAEVTGGDATKQRVRATLRSALSDAARQGLLMTNPASLVKLPSGKRPRALVWTPEREQRWREACERLAASNADDNRAELEEAARPPSATMVWQPGQLAAFLDAARDDRLYAMFHLIAHRGLRRGEACGVAWADLDLDRGLLYIRRQLVQLGWSVLESAPKSAAGERVIALDAGTVAVLRAHRKTQLAERLAWGDAWNDSGKIFCKEDGAPVHPATVTARFHALTAKAGLPPVRLHDLRHGAASLMLAAGVAMRTVMETLGHSSMTITSDTYSSVYPQVAADAAEATAALIARSTQR